MNHRINLISNEIQELDDSLSSFDYLKITIASPERIKYWATRVTPNGIFLGQIKKAKRPESSDFKAETDGLFCEKIFGPARNWRCQCGKFYGFLINAVCDECHVELTEARVRKYRMGYIELNSPVIHFWYNSGIPNYLLLLLKIFNDKISYLDIQNIIYRKTSFKDINLFFNSDAKSLTKLNFLDKIKNKNFDIDYDWAPTILKELLESINLEKEIEFLRKKLLLFEKSSLKKDIFIQIRILESLLLNNINPSWLILTRLPVSPPTSRPYMSLESGTTIMSDFNELYYIILECNEKILYEIKNKSSHSMILYVFRKQLQETIDALFNNSKLNFKKQVKLNNKPLKSLSELLEGKFGRFRQYLLGKRVDFSARSVIVVNPLLRLNQCCLPFDIVIEIFKPFLINILYKKKTLKISTSTLLFYKNSYIFPIINKFIKNFAILLNRAPTLHRLGFQAFTPILSFDKTIQIHPLVCSGFNADFDGDQMAVHLPLSITSQIEVKSLLYSSQNIISASNNNLNLKPTQDSLIGCYYLTALIKKYKKLEAFLFLSIDEALIAYLNKKINLHTPILISIPSSLCSIHFTNKFIYLFSYLYNTKDTTPTKLKILKIYKSDFKYYIITEIGILYFKENLNNKLELINIFLESTVGRLIFMLTLNNSILKNL